MLHLNLNMYFKLVGVIEYYGMDMGYDNFLTYEGSPSFPTTDLFVPHFW